MIRIFGNSDDQVYVVQDGAREQLSPTGEDDVTIGIGLNASPPSGCFVTMHYGVGCSIGVWTATIAMIDEGIPIPWPVRIEMAKASEQIGPVHSVAVIIECPPGTPWEIAPRDD